MEQIMRFSDYYSVVSGAVLLVELSGRILAANHRARLEFSLAADLDANEILLKDLFSDDPNFIKVYLRQCARVGSPLPGAFAGGRNGEVRYSLRGQRSPFCDSRAPTVTLYIQPNDNVIKEFLILNDKVSELSKEIKRRQALEDERAELLAREKAARELAEKSSARANLAANAKAQFLAQMSHEIRSPLNAILGFSDLLLEEGLAEANKSDFVQRIRTSGKHLLRIIDDILDLSKFEAGKVPIQPVYFSIVELLDEIVQSLRPLSKAKGLELNLKFQGLIPQVIRSDPSRVRQILTNLIGNAMKFTDSGGIEVNARFDTSATQRDCCLIFEITDSGIGISAEQQARLFQPFEQGDAAANRRFSGTGLGLVISKRTAEALGGKLELVRSDPGVGTTFCLVIPTGDVSESLFVKSSGEAYIHEKQQLHAFADKGPRLKGRKILLAEDSLDGADLVTLYLELEGASVRHVTNGFEAIQAAGEDRFDLILMDIQMPMMDGLLATENLRSKGFTLPILALTAHALREEVDKSLNAGCDAHLTKPITKSALVGEILCHLSGVAAGGLL
ncbi:MAG: response regulator [Bdellovibrionaceae bacterium]|nr:response regulator [Pseudobdellovibrionaceae bacterium]